MRGKEALTPLGLQRQSSLADDVLLTVAGDAEKESAAAEKEYARAGKAQDAARSLQSKNLLDDILSEAQA